MCCDSIHIRTYVLKRRNRKGIMAYCGLMCSECRACKATVADDMSLREKTAETWSSMFGAGIKPEDINCLGCDSDVRFSLCNVCGTRSCAREKRSATADNAGTSLVERYNAFLSTIGARGSAIRREKNNRRIVNGVGGIRKAGSKGLPFPILRFVIVTIGLEWGRPGRNIKLSVFFCSLQD